MNGWVQSTHIMIKIRDGFRGERTLVLPQSIVKEMEEDPVSSVLHITDIGFYPEARHHYRERQTPISQYVLIYCTGGKGWFSANGIKHMVTANQYFILPAGVPHAYGADENNPWTIYWVHFKGKLASHFARGCITPSEIRPTIDSRISDRIEMFEEIFRTLEMGYSHENLLYACSIFHHYLGTLRYLRQYRDAARQEPDRSDIVTAAIHFMKENIERKLTLAEIAAHTGYSLSYFSSMFNSRTGHAPLSYFNQLKIQQACRLLDHTDMKINQVSYKIGINDTFYFSRLFSKVMGMSPRKYKSMKKG